MSKLLKSAKNCLESDPDEAIGILKQVIKADPRCVNGFLLLGKAYIIKQDVAKAEASLKSCIDIDSSNLNAWKGYYSVICHLSDMAKFMRVSGEYSNVLVELHQTDLLRQLAQQVTLYLKKLTDESPQVLAEYYRYLIPNTVLGENCGGMIVNSYDALTSVLKFQLKIENDTLKKQGDVLRLKHDKAEYHQKMTEFRWLVFSHSDVAQLYQMLIDFTHDDDKRLTLEDDLLRYKYQVLQTIPEGDIKKQYRHDIFEMISGMVVVKHKSLFAWELYFDLSNYSTIEQINTQELYDFIRLFYGRGLANMLLGYALSDISPFNPEEVRALKQEIDNKEAIKTKSRNKISQSELEKANLVNSDTSASAVSADEVLTLMVSGFEDCRRSLLAHRVLSLYYIYLQEYEQALTVCKSGIDILISVIKLTGFDLSQVKQFFTVQLAVVYTYHEAPKNFPSALLIYDSLLKQYPDNTNAKVGKGEVYMEQGDLEEARALLQDVVDANPNDSKALVSLSWCQIQLGELQTGRLGLQHCLLEITATNVRSYELRSIILYRLAQSYLYEIETTLVNVDSLVAKAYENLLNSLKANKNNAAAYTSLGVVYSSFYDDKIRATKCYYRAFELDAAELSAGRYLVENFASKAEWDLAEVLCDRIVVSEKARRKLARLQFDKSWPYRVLGIAALESQNGEKAVEWFQSAIRLSLDDVESWVGLGESYLLFGRLESATKVFNRAITIDADNWHAKYLLGVTQGLIKEYAAAIETLKSVLEQRPGELCVLVGVYQALADAAVSYYKGGFYGRAVESALESVNYLVEAAAQSHESSMLWKSLVDVIRLFLKIQSELPKFPQEKYLEIVSLVDIKDEYSDNVTLETTKQALDADKLNGLCHLLVLCGKCAVATLGPSSTKILRATTYFNLGICELEVYRALGKSVFQEVAITSLQKAILLDSSNPDAWVALGAATVSKNPRIAQHCFIKATALDSKNGDIWNNLASLYLRYGDVELSQQAFLKAQSVSPQLAKSWLGDALAADVSGANAAEASRLFTHAYVLSNGRSPLAQLLYGLSVSNGRIGSGDSKSDISVTQELAMASEAMGKYCRHYPDDPVALEISCNLFERLGDYSSGKVLAEKLCAIHECQYEESESEVVLVKFARSKSQFARFCLAEKDYENCIDSAQFTLGILDADEPSPETLDCILSARTVLGLAYYFLQELEPSIEEFKTILHHSKSARSFVVLISQVLYNFGSAETKQAALEELFEYISQNGSSLVIVLTLAAIGILEADTQLLQAVQEELQGLKLEDLLQDPYHKVPEITIYVTKRLKEVDETNVWQRNALMFPNDYTIWRHLDANMAAVIGSSSQAVISADQLSLLYVETGELRMIQRGMIFNPESLQSYMALAGVTA